MSIFDSVKGMRVPKNKFDLSHEKKMSMKMGTLTPFLLQEIIPGDSFRVNTEMLMRLQPMLAPIFHRVRVKTDYFFVPNRLVWENWQKFITGGDTGADNPVHPYITIDNTGRGNFAKGSLADYMGIPPVETPTVSAEGQLQINALPFRAYQLVYNEYYRDQNLQSEVTVNKTDGAIATGSAEYNSLLTMRNRAWEKDYFTSCLPWAQKGGPVVVPSETVYHADGSKLIRADTGLPLPNEAGIKSVAGGVLEGTGSAGIPANIDNLEGVNITVNDLRVAVRLQEWLERNARAGSRYIENILANFGVLSSDARLQRPEWLGGNINPIVISEVLSTYQNADDSGYPQGTMAGHGISTGGNGGFKRKFEEHGFVIGLMTIIPRTAYQQGVDKMWSRFDKLEYAWPSFAQLGEQAVLNQELYYNPEDTGIDITNKATFGYQSRYAEYKYKPSTVHGDFRDNLDYWHMGRKFTAAPVLNEAFIKADPTKRIFAVTDPTEDEILCQIYNRVDAIRPLPYFNSPTL
ncbi:MAG: major capsid protein [Microviridae sp.]|nr:MAG: major capsid protein [Microviridae sp.]